MASAEFHLSSGNSSLQSKRTRSAFGTRAASVRISHARSYSGVEKAIISRSTTRTYTGSKRALAASCARMVEIVWCKVSRDVFAAEETGVEVAGAAIRFRSNARTSSTSRDLR